MYELRPYQQDGVEQIRDAFRRHNAVCYALPTGGGKTVIFAYIVAAAAAKGTHTMILAHRQEIFEQISDALDLMGVPHGEIRPQAKMSDQPIQLAMVQTAHARLRHMPKFGFIVIDECHHAVSKTWADVIEHCGPAKVLGVTATPERLDGRGLEEQFDHLICGPDVRWLIDHGYLAPIEYLAPPSAVDLTGVRMAISGDYDPTMLAERVDKPAITGDAIRYYRDKLYPRTALAFCITVAHARHFAEALCEDGIAADVIHGEMQRDDRRAVVEALRSGAISVLVSCEVISEGFDVPAVGGAILLRPTASLVVHRQQCGRALRPKDGGAPAVILDHVENVVRHNLPDSPHEWTLGARIKRHGVAPDVERVVNKRSIDQVDGALVDVLDTAWAGELDVRAAPLRELMELCRADPVKIRQVRILRGYKPGWEFWQMKRAIERWGDPAAAASDSGKDVRPTAIR